MGLTQDGIQDVFGVNHVGHFLFTLLLLPTIKASSPSRIVNVSSIVHRYPPSGGIEFDKLNDPNVQTAIQGYFQAKLANVLFTIELSKRLLDANVYCNCLHPGVINTELSRGHFATWSFWMKPLARIISIFLLTLDDGALTQLYCATSPEIEEKNYRGKYFVPFGVLGKTSNYGKDEELAKKLWDFSENFVKEKLGDDILSKCFD
ncbi:31791_t:CDS:2 [Racocetra persica]|uniref:31791_t:CDS:1 n=1 Tax=Racocetra persica TaxID=160502 RepID=A0ACA9MMT0_9GLOM|nr:31791_t:CDS:2 [Racocetra persica]